MFKILLEFVGYTKEIQQQAQQVAQQTQTSSNEIVGLLGMIEQIFKTLHMEYWFIALPCLFFVSGLKEFLCYFDLDNKQGKFFGIPLKKGWWRAVKHNILRITSILFGWVFSFITVKLVGDWLGEPSIWNHWFVLGITNGLGSIIAWHALNKVGLIKFIEPSTSKKKNEKVSE